MTVYADVLVALNILITYIIIVASRVLCKIPTNKWAVSCACVLGGVSSIVIFFEDGGAVFSLIYKLITGAVIVGIGFLPKSPKTFIKALSAFFGVSFLFGGGVYALEITAHPKNILFYNGTVYFDMSITYLVGCVLSIYGVFLLANFFLTRHTLKGAKCELKIIFGKSAVTLPALIDTGNSLTDGLSGRPVIVAELGAVSPLFTMEELKFFKSGNYDEVPDTLKKVMRLIPCTAVTGESLLKAFLPDSVKIKTRDKTYTSDFCTVAVTDRELSEGEYRALLNYGIFENGREEKNNDTVFA